MSTIAYDYATESKRVMEALRAALGENAAIKTSEGWRGRVHVKVVSPLFDGKDAREKQKTFYEILREGLGTESKAVSLAEVYGIDEI